jgi:hypothetical protein
MLSCPSLKMRTRDLPRNARHRWPDTFFLPFCMRHRKMMFEDRIARGIRCDIPRSLGFDYEWIEKISGEGIMRYSSAILLCAFVWHQICFASGALLFFFLFSRKLQSQLRLKLTTTAYCLELKEIWSVGDAVTMTVLLSDEVEDLGKGQPWQHIAVLTEAKNK